MKKICLLTLVLVITISCTKTSEPSPPSAPAAPTAKVTDTFSGKTFALTGKVTFTGTVPSGTVKMSADPVCAKAHTGKTVAQYAVVVSPAKELANVFVSIKDGNRYGGGAVPTEPVVLDQRGCLYEPHVMGIRVGQPMSIVNSDPTMHNVNAQSKAGQGFNAGMPTLNQTIKKSFTKPEQMVKFKCDVHGWMSAYLGVMDHPFFAVSSPSGVFTIPNLPEGKYTAELWHESLGTKSVDFEITGKDAAVAVAFP